MLTLQRASAGSGKTFTLAKTFIRDFLAIKTADGSYRLRTKEELKDAHSHILAITFTNKATNEMKQRIVEKLADIAGVTGKPRKKIDYLDDFMAEFGATEDSVKSVAKEGLAILLHNYTDFQVSTIDSFFQMVLRTFANEIELNDSYQVELSEDYISQVGVDATLTQVNEQKSEVADNVAFWLTLMINEKLADGQTWDIFRKNDGKNNSQTLYASLISFSKIIQKEVFKSLQDEFSAYFRRVENFKNIYLGIRRVANENIEKHRQRTLSAIKFVEDTLASEGYTVNEVCISGLSGQFDKLKKWSGVFSLPEIEIKQTVDKFLKGEISLFKKGVNKNGKLDDTFKGLPDKVAEVYDLAKEWYACSVKWLSGIKKLHFLGLLQSILENTRKFREERNVLPISETNQILRRIINEEDTPFIYERIGTYLNHYLIDEFQDTSLMQWANLQPLLAESLGNGNDNLIIGDAKQSIYRFRNAEPDLITSIVPSKFNCNLRGESVEENTNWRSSKEIVMFNNTIFPAFAHSIDKVNSSSECKRRSVAELYGNIVQQIHNEDKPGYITIDFIECKNKSEKNDYYKEMGNVVLDMLGRGYRQSDIAFLVSGHRDGANLISALMQFNANAKEEGRQEIKIISDESLKVAESKAVKMVIAVLEVIVKGYGRREGNAEGHTRIELSEFCCNYNFLAANDSTLLPAEIVEKLLKEKLPTGDIYEMMKDMQSVALPALIEAIVARFVPEKLRESDVAYISALQDLVLEYCDSYPADIASFLKWWTDNEYNFAISSPEGADAVQIMTIHKSKGLEFKCVIIPSADWTIYPENKKEELLWVKPEFPADLSSVGEMPPYIPIVANSMLAETSYREVYYEYADKEIIDRLNKTYVAFTRAVDEMRIFAFYDKLSDAENNIAVLLHNTLNSIDAFLSENSADTEKKYMFAPGEILFNSETKRVEIGCPGTNDTSKDKKKGLPNKSISNYYVNPDTSILHIKTDDMLRPVDDEDDKDPRSVGNLMHTVMSGIKVAEDVPKVVKRLKIRGLIPYDMEETYLKEIMSALSHPRVAPWFADDLVVYNERPLVGTNKLCKRGKRVELSDRKKEWRPDRFIVTPENNVVVIDYKFGEKSDVAKNRTQVAEYIRLLKSTRKYASVSGFLWYVSLGIVEEISDEYPKVILPQTILD